MAGMFEFDGYHVLLLAIGASVINSYWFPRFFPGWEPTASALVLLSGTIAHMFFRGCRSYGSGAFVFDPLHYLSPIETKPNALDQAAPLKDWNLPEAFPPRPATRPFRS